MGKASEKESPIEALRGAGNDILKYQANRPLSQCPGFEVSAQVLTGKLGGIFIGLRLDCLEIYTADDKQYIFDLEGRPIRFSTPNEYRFRGVSHVGTVVKKRPRGSGGGGMIRQRLDSCVLAESCREAWAAAKAALAALGEGDRIRWASADPAVARGMLAPVLEKAESWTPSRLEAESARFAEVYQPVPVLPPDHYGSLVLQATEGCSFNTCTFCTLYGKIPFRIRSVAEFDRHIEAALAFHGEGLKRFTQIFLGQANALAIPQARLVDLMQRIRDRLELPESDPDFPARPSWAHGQRSRFLGIGSFLDGFTGLNKSADDYASLRKLGLTRVYLGVESGSADLLKWLRKPATPDEMIETLRRLKEAGIATDVILLVGAGGSHWAREHIDSSLSFLKDSPLRPGDRVMLSELVDDQAREYVLQMNERGWAPLGQDGLEDQRAELRSGIRKLGLQAVPYRIEPFAY